MSADNRKAPLISRWSRLKRHAKHGDGDNLKSSLPDASSQANATLADDGIHPGIKHPIAAPVNDIFTQLAIKQIIALPEWSILDGLNEYDDDYSNFSPLGGSLTHDLVRQYQRDANRLATAIDPKISAAPSDGDPTNVQGKRRQDGCSPELPESDDTSDSDHT